MLHFLREAREFLLAGGPRIYLGPHRAAVVLLPLGVAAACGAASWSGAAGWTLLALVLAQNFLYRLLLDVGQPAVARDAPAPGAPAVPASPSSSSGWEHVPRAAGGDGPAAGGGFVDTLVIGGGAAGLAAAACLVRRGVPVLVLEAGREIGAQWRGRYDRLHLHTEKEASGLPYVPFPDHVPMYPSKDDVADYLAAYQRQMRVPVAFGQRVASLEPAGDGDGGGDGARWAVATEAGARYRARCVVVAVGESAEPVEPVFEGERKEFAGETLHSSAYRSGEAYRGRRVLVVGFGNSGAEMAMDLVEHGAAAVECVVRSPQLVANRDVLPGGWLNSAAVGQAGLLNFMPWRVADAAFRLFLLDYSRWGVRPSAQSFSEMLAAHRSPVLDIGMMRLVSDGRIRVRPALERFAPGGQAVFADGERASYDVLLKATGFRSGLARLFASDEERGRHLTPEGHPRVHGRETAPGSGLYFNGYVDHIGKLRQMAIEGMRVARHVARRGQA